MPHEITCINSGNVGGASCNCYLVRTDDGGFILEIILWIIFLPWVGSLWIWHSSLALWLRILIIAVIALATIGMFNRRKVTGRRRARTS